MENLIRKEWPLGWIPSDDQFNGRPEGLLRMDNLNLDENGIVGLVPGTKKISSGMLGSDISRIFSRVIGNRKYRYLFSNGEVYRNYGSGFNSETAFETGVLTGGDIKDVGFGVGFGHVIICSGDKKIRDDGASIEPLGTIVGGAPTAVVQTPESIQIYGSYTGWESVEDGTTFNVTATYIEVNTSANNRAIVQKAAATADPVLNTFPSGAKGTAWDLFRLSLRVGDSSKFVKCRIEFSKEDNAAPGTSSDVENYFWYEWKSGEEFTFTNSGVDYQSGIRQGINAWSELITTRELFHVVGNPSWDAINGVRISITSTEENETYIIENMKFDGGEKGALNGTYSYAQVNVTHTIGYAEMSPASAFSPEITVKNSRVQITPSAIPAGAEAWIFRIGGTNQRWYRIDVRANDTPFYDERLDADIAIDGIELDINNTALPDGIVGIEGPFKGRMLYLTMYSIIPSKYLNPSSYDARHAIENSADQTEVNLFIAKVSDDEIYVGTTNDIYSITGNGEELGDNGEIINFQIRPLGIKQPPINRAFCVEGNVLYYFASDGIRAIAGSSSAVVSEQLMLLYNKNLSTTGNRHGIPPVRVGPNNSVIMDLCYSNRRLIACVEHYTLGRAIHVFDFTKKYWYPAYINSEMQPLSVFTEEDGTVISGGRSANSWVRELFIGKQFDESGTLPVVFRTVFDDNGLPYNRKDTATLKIIADTGNVDAVIQIYKDGSATPANIASQKFNGREEKFYDLQDLVGKGKSFQLSITGNFSTCKIYGFEILYERLPTQISRLLTPYNNLGTVSRKRIISFPFVMDSLNTDCTVTPYVDGVAKIPAVYKSNRKQTIVHYFTEDVVGTDLALHIDCEGGVFEPYEFPWNEAIFEKLPIPTKFMVIPTTDFGTAARKRINRISFVADLRGGTLTFIPIFDGVDQEPQAFTGTGKRTYSYYFTAPANSNSVVFVDMSGKLSSATEFEFYELLKPQIMEVLPEPVTHLVIPYNNLGVPAKKRIRTIPLVLDTRGQNVIYTPKIDGISYPSSTFNTNEKTTVLHYLESDVFGIDVGGELDGQTSTPFEFYELLTPKNVETLPVGVKLDQFGPIQFDRLGKIKTMFLNLLCTGTAMTYRFYHEDDLKYTNTFTTVPGKQKIYTIQMPVGININLLRVELQSANVFHRFEASLKVDISGNGTKYQTVRFK